ncbi:MAG: aromatic amino acid lyase [Deltaproteobacteria bacterium]|nr:aromatic amino acid lyase [Deltaproteobacteria bacterium]
MLPRLFCVRLDSIFDPGEDGAPGAGRRARTALSEIVIGEGPVGLELIAAAACGRIGVRLSGAASFRERLERSRRALDSALERGEPVYGVSTGFGRACGRRVDPAEAAALGAELVRFHCCGLGEPLAMDEVRAAVLCRLIGLAQGYSGVRHELLQAFVDLLSSDVVPLIPSQGSVGASGDLTPLSYLVACMAGEREAFFAGQRMPAAEALRRAGLSPFAFAPKEALAIVNGTSVMTGIAALAAVRASHVLDAAVCGTALAVHALSGHARHFCAGLVDAKPHPGSRRVAAALRALLASHGPVPESDSPEHLQDPYSCRCAPQVLGVLSDALGWIRPWLEREANSANDNPLVDPDTGEVWTGGNFYGGHVAFAADCLKAALATAAGLCERQVALLVDARFSRGLPADLVRDASHGLMHGFKAVQITATALAAELARAAMPAAVFSRSTESHNQDTVSLGTISARDAIRAVRGCARVVAVQLAAAAQAAELRGGIEGRPALEAALERVRALSPKVDADRALDAELERLAGACEEGDLFAGLDAIRPEGVS